MVYLQAALSSAAQPADSAAPAPRRRPGPVPPGRAIGRAARQNAPPPPALPRAGPWLARRPVGHSSVYAAGRRLRAAAITAVPHCLVAPQDEWPGIAGRPPAACAPAVAPVPPTGRTAPAVAGNVVAPRGVSLQPAHARHWPSIGVQNLVPTRTSRLRPARRAAQSTMPRPRLGAP